MAIVLGQSAVAVKPDEDTIPKLFLYRCDRQRVKLETPAITAPKFKETNHEKPDEKINRVEEQ
jgi:hypothetical protein